MVRSRLSPVAFLVGLSLITAACGTTSGNTLAQDLAYERYQSCQYVTNNIFLDRIDADGNVGIHMINGTAGYQEWRECMRKAAENQATARATAPPPQPVASGTGATPSSTMATTPVPTPAPLPDSIVVPIWRPGEEWAYRWESPSGKGIHIESVDRTE